MKTKSLFGMAALIAICLISCPVLGAEFHVATSQELQTALAASVSNSENDVIFVGAGVYYGNFSHQTTEEFSLTIKAEDGLNQGQVVLDGDGLGNVLILRAVDKNVDFTLEKLTLRNGKGQYGAGLHITTDGNALIDGCSFTENALNVRYYSYGGGIYILSANEAEIKNSNISDNSPKQDYQKGVGIFIQDATSVELTNNIISGNGKDSTQRHICGGGLDVEHADSLFMTRNLISNNQSCDEPGGGALLYDVDQVELRENVISYNNAKYGNGGGIYIDGFYGVTAEKNEIVGNYANYGAGMYVQGAYANSTLHFVDNQISDNVANVSYGALYVTNVTNASTIEFADNRVKNNRSNGDQGTVNIYSENASGTLIFTGNRIVNNTCKREGGAVLKSGIVTCINNVIVDNQATDNNVGGLYIYLPLQAVYLINNTIYGNSAAGTAGGLQISLNTGTQVFAYNNNIWGNTAVSGGADIMMTGTGSNNKNLFNNNIGEKSGTLWDFAGNNIDVDPLFLDPDDHDYQLRADSLCLNAGDNSAPELPEKDIAGNVRVADAVVDIGAYEHSTSDPHPADLDGDFTITIEEFNAYGEAWRYGNDWDLGPNPIPIDYATRAGYLLQSGGLYENQGGGKPEAWVPAP